MPRGKRVTPQEAADMRRLCIQGLPFTEIAKRFGVSRQTASRHAQNPLALQVYHVFTGGRPRQIFPSGSEVDVDDLVSIPESKFVPEPVPETTAVPELATVAIPATIPVPVSRPTPVPVTTAPQQKAVKRAHGIADEKEEEEKNDLNSRRSGGSTGTTSSRGDLPSTGAHDRRSARLDA